MGLPSRVTRKTNKGKSMVEEDSSVFVKNLDVSKGKTQSVEEKNASMVEAEGEGMGPCSHGRVSEHENN